MTANVSLSVNKVFSNALPVDSQEPGNAFLSGKSPKCDVNNAASVVFMVPVEPNSHNAKSGLSNSQWGAKKTLDCKSESSNGNRYLAFSQVLTII